MVAALSPYIVAFSALTFAGVSALTLISFVNGLDGTPAATAPASANEHRVAA
jgi:hypothetical protein